MGPLRDEDLIRDPAIRRAVELRRAVASTPVSARSRHWPAKWLIVGTIGVLMIVLIGLVRLAS